MTSNNGFNDRTVIYSDIINKRIKELSSKYPRFDDYLRALHYFLSRDADNGESTPGYPHIKWVNLNVNFAPNIECCYRIVNSSVHIEEFEESSDE